MIYDKPIMQYFNAKCIQIPWFIIYHILQKNNLSILKNFQLKSFFIQNRNKISKT